MGEKGFSFIELIVAVTIISLVVYGASGLIVIMFRSSDVDREKLIMTNIAACRVEEWRSYGYGDIRPGMNFTYFRSQLLPAMIAGHSTYQAVFSSRTIIVPSIEKIYRDAGNTKPPVTEPGYNLGIVTQGGRNGDKLIGGTRMWFAGPPNGGSAAGVIIATITCPSGVNGILNLGLQDIEQVVGGFIYGGRRGEGIYINNFLEDDGVKQGIDFNNGAPFIKTFTQDETSSGQIVIRIQQRIWSDGASNFPIYFDPAVDSTNPDAVLTSISFSAIEGFSENDAFASYQVRSELISTYAETAVSGLVPAWKIWVTVSKQNSSYDYHPIQMATTIVK